MFRTFRIKFRAEDVAQCWNSTCLFWQLDFLFWQLDFYTFIFRLKLCCFDIWELRRKTKAHDVSAVEVLRCFFFILAEEIETILNVGDIIVFQWKGSFQTNLWSDSFTNSVDSFQILHRNFLAFRNSVSTRIYDILLHVHSLFHCFTPSH